MHVNTVKAVNRKSFSGNEGRDVQQRNFFTANKKQYMVIGNLCKRKHLQFENSKLISRKYSQITKRLSYES